jgi:hypothetical protein
VFFWSFIVALVLFSLGGLFSVYEGLAQDAPSQELSYPWVGGRHPRLRHLAEAVSLRACLQEVNKVRGWPQPVALVPREPRERAGRDPRRGPRGAARPRARPRRGAAHHCDGKPRWDALGSMAIGAVLIVVAGGIGHEIKALLIGQSADPDDGRAHARVPRAARRRREALRPADAAARHLRDGGGQGAHEGRSADELVAASTDCEAAMRVEFPEIQCSSSSRT